MTGTPTFRAGAAALVLMAALIALSAGEGSATAQPRGGSGSNRALVVIDDGVTRTEACIFFPGTIDGIEALERSGTETVLAGFGGMGAAVCALGGVGCSASSCLTCQAPKFWHYLRSERGSTAFTTSPLGAGASKVGDGDVEAWIWGSSISIPPLPSVDAVCGRAVTTTTVTVRPSPTTTVVSRPGGGMPAPTTVLSIPPSGGIVSPTPPPDPATTVPAPPPSVPALAGPDPTVLDGAGSPPSTDGPAGDDRSEPDREGSDEEDDSTDAKDQGATTSRPDRQPGARGQVEVAAGPSDGGHTGGAGGWLGVGAVLVLVTGLGGWAIALRRRATT